MCNPKLKEEDEDAYRDAVDALWKEYRPKFEAKLREIRECFANEGWTIAPDILDFSDEEYQLGISISLEGRQAGVSITLLESLCCDRSLEGVSFSLDLQAQCGGGIGGLAPFNYTGELWVLAPSAEAIAERWDYIENAEDYEAEHILREHITNCNECMR